MAACCSCGASSKGKSRVDKRAVLDATGGVPNSVATEILGFEYLRGGHIIDVCELIPVSIRGNELATKATLEICVGYELESY